MVISMKTRTKALLWTFGAVLVIVLVVFSVQNYIIGGKYSSSLEYSYARSLGDLTDELEEMSNALEKAAYASTATMQHQVSTAIISSGGGAKAAVSYLPMDDERSAKVEKLISVAEDYAAYAGRKLAAGEGFTEEDKANFAKIKEFIDKLHSELSKIRGELDENNLKIGKAEQLLSQTLNVPDAPTFDNGLDSIVQELDSFPTMLYDGPFSDHIEQKEAEFLKDKQDVTKEQAIEKAAQFLSTDISLLKCENETEGALASFEVRGDNMSVNVTKKGGEVVWAKKSMDISESKLSYEEALEKAKEFLSKSGLGEAKESYYIINDNTCTINFSGIQENVVLYPDLIKITVELNEGGIVEYSAEGYLMNHKERELPEPKLTEDEAAQNVDKSLKVKNTAMAFIPTEGKNEVLTYEFTCENQDGSEILVYINSDSGMEEKVYILQKSETGVLVK